jgi:hypothetical protein
LFLVEKESTAGNTFLIYYHFYLCRLLYQFGNSTAIQFKLCFGSSHSGSTSTSKSIKQAVPVQNLLGVEILLTSGVINEVPWLCRQVVVELACTLNSEDLNRILKANYRLSYLHSPILYNQMNSSQIIGAVCGKTA